MRILAIGDIHGSASQLRALLAVDELYRGRRVVFLGDFVDVGPDARAVIELLLAFRASRSDTVFLRGNHDIALIEYLRSGDFGRYASSGDISTIRSYCGEVHGDVHRRLLEDLPETHRRFVDDLDIYFETSDCLFSHAGYDPDRPTDRSLRAMVLSSHQRLFEKEPPLQKTAVCGHYFQASYSPFITERFVCLDTGCAVLNGPLTALTLPERRIVQAWPDLTLSQLQVPRTD